MSNQNRFSKALTKPAKDRPELDMALSTAEAVSDIMLKDELIAAVPLFSTAFKAVKALDSFRDRLFVAKLQAFISEAQPRSEGERAAMAAKLTGDDEGRKAGETLLLVLDKLTDLDKPALLGALLRHFGLGRIDSADLRRLANAIDLAFADDLAAFLEEPPEEAGKNSNKPHREALTTSGLTRVLTGDTIDLLGSIYFGVTPAGEMLHAFANRTD